MHPGLKNDNIFTVKKGDQKRVERLEDEIRRNFIQKKKAHAILKFEKALTETVHNQLLSRTLDLYLQVKQPLYPNRPKSSASNFSSFTEYSADVIVKSNAD